MFISADYKDNITITIVHKTILSHTCVTVKGYLKKLKLFFTFTLRWLTIVNANVMTIKLTIPTLMVKGRSFVK